MTKDKTKYIIHGQVIQSDFDLSPCPKATSKAAAKINIINGQTLLDQNKTLFHILKFPNKKIYARFYQLKSGYLVNFPSQGDFLISNSGKKINCFFKSRLNSTEKTVLLTNHALPLALSVQGRLVIHAAAVLVKNQLTLICAPAGLGKSTLAAYFERQGLRVLSDDTCVLKKKGSSFYSSLSVPLLRTWKKSKKEKAWQLLDPSKPLKWYKVGSLHFPYIDHKSKAFKKIQPRRLSPLQATKALLPEVFRLNWKANHITQELNQISNLSKTVPCFDWPHQHRHQALKAVTSLLLKGPR